MVKKPPDLHRARGDNSLWGSSGDTSGAVGFSVLSFIFFNGVCLVLWTAETMSLSAMQVKLFGFSYKVCEPMGVWVWAVTYVR